MLFFCMLPVKFRRIRGNSRKINTKPVEAKKLFPLNYVFSCEIELFSLKFLYDCFLISS
jgi:hypothetical protein